MNKMVSFVGMFVMLLVSAVVAAQPATEVLEVQGLLITEQTGDSGEIITAGVAVPVIDVEDQTEYDKIHEELTSICGADSACYYEHASAKVGRENIHYKSIEDAEIGFAYYNPQGGEYVTVPGCENVKATGEETLGEPWETAYYYAECTIPDEIYRGSKIRVMVAYLGSGYPVEIDGDTYIVTTDPKEMEVSDFETNVIDKLYTTIVNKLRNATEEEPGICIGFFLLLGLLLASMYFSGKTPITLLDITTPRMPSPKGLAAGGQVLLPYGYGEMKGAMLKKRAANTALTLNLANQIRKGVAGSNDERGIEQQLAKHKPGTLDAKKDKDLTRSLAYGALATGDKAAAKQLAGKLPQEFGDAEHKSIAQILAKLKQMGGKHAIMADTMKDTLLINQTMKSYSGISGKVGQGRLDRWHGKVQNALGKFVGANRYNVTSAMIMGSYDSAVRSTRWVGRGTAAMAAPLAKKVGETTVKTVGKATGIDVMRRLEKKAKVSKAAAAVVAAVKPGKDLVIGKKVDIINKMGHAYETLKDEAKKDQIKYLLKQVYKALGVNFNITEKDLVEMGMKDVDVLEVSGYNKVAGKIKGIEKELMSILGSKMTSDDKIRALSELAKLHGAKIDSAMFAFNDKLNKIDQTYGADDGHLKYIALREMLAEHERAAPAPGVNELSGDKFYTVIGRPSVNGSSIWETMVLRTLTWDAENGKIREGAGLKESMLRSYVETVNRMVGLNPTADLSALPEFMRNKTEMSKIEARVKSILVNDLMTDKGRAALEKMTGGSAKGATITDVIKMLEGAERGMPEVNAKVDRFGRVARYEEKEVGPGMEHFKVDLQRRWVGAPDQKEAYQIGMWVENIFTRSNIGTQHPRIDAELKRVPGYSTMSIEEKTSMAKKLWITDQMKKDFEMRFNSQFASDAYGKMPERSNFYMGLLTGYYAKVMRDQDLQSNHPDKYFVEKLDASSAAQLKKFRTEIAVKYDKGLRKEISTDVTFDDVLKSKQPLVQLYEGDWGYYSKGMAVGVGDKIHGEVALRDDKGQWRKFVAEDTAIDFKGRPELQQEFHKLRDKQPGADWDHFMNSAKAWSKEGGYERKKVYAALVYNYGRNTSDYTSYWKDTNVSVKPIRDVMDIAPQSLRMLGVTENNLVRKTMSIWRNAKVELGGYFCKTAMIGAGAAFDASYDIIPNSEYLRQHSMKLAKSIYTMDPNEWKRMSHAERSLYGNVASSHFAYHHAWQWAIDRANRTSASLGLLQTTENYFHHGPGHILGGVQDYVRGPMTGRQWTGFMAFYGWPANLAAKVHKPFVNTFRHVQVAMTGAPGRYDRQPDSLKPFEYSNPRMLAAARSVTNILGTGKLSKLKVWESVGEQRHQAGAEIMEGLRAGPSEMFDRRTGVFSIAREGDANPACSYYTYRHELKMDEAMAGYLWRNKDSVYQYDKEVKQQAMTHTVRRTVSAEALSIRMDQEARGFGVAQNPIYKFFNPIGFAWHASVIPGVTSWSLRDTVTRWAERRKYGGGMPLTARLKETSKDLAEGSWRAMTPWKGASVVACPRCGKFTHRGSVCRCGNQLYVGKMGKKASGF